MRKYIAHKRISENGIEEIQLLKEHLENVAKLTGEFAKEFDASECGYLIGLLHDLGKYSEEFQNYIKEIENAKRGDIIHSFQGSQFIFEKIKEPLIAEILGNCVASHHGGLYDLETGVERTLPKKIKTYEEAKLKFLGEFCNDEQFFLNLIQKINNEICEIWKRAYDNKLNTYFMLHLWTKALYSCLIDADRIDAAQLTIDKNILDWNIYINKLECHLSTFSNSSELENVRKVISEQCKNAGEREIGIYTLNVPTGAGKTLSSLRFALEHSKKHNLKKIIYVIPYLSILDQTAKVIKDIIKDDEAILEHHSNIEVEEEDENNYKVLTSRWDCQIILTTMVQFLETSYSNKASHLRKFHNMANSVIIFDEIQSLPIKCIHLFNDCVNFLNIFGKSSILLCTATQPHLDKVDIKVHLNDSKSDIVNLTDNEKKCFERTKIIKIECEVLDLIKKQITENKNTLVILNTKITAREIFEKCKDLNCEKIFLSTDLCPAHRLQNLEKMKKNLKEKMLTLCVSTQLIEAGVDVSFECVIRACAGADSIIQAAGRANRNGEKQGLQEVFIVNIENENLNKLPEIKIGKEITERVYRDKNNLDIDCYYNYYFNQKELKKKMDFLIENGKESIYHLLNIGENFRANTAFAKAANNFSVLDSKQTGIIVQFEDALELVGKFRKEVNLKEKYKILKKLQKYTVQVYSNKLKKLQELNAVCLIDKIFYILNKEYYDEEIGLLCDEQHLAFLEV